MASVMSGLRERQKSERSRRMLAAARVRFGKYNYNDVSLGSIAKDAAVSVATVYNYYGSKAGLLLALVKESDVLLVDQLAGLVRAPPPDPREGIAHFAMIMRRHVLEFLTRPTWRQILAASILEGGSTFGRDYLSLDAVLIEIMAQMLDSYQRAGSMRLEASSAELGTTVFALQNMRFFEFVSDDAITEAAADRRFRTDIDVMFGLQLCLSLVPDMPASAEPLPTAVRSTRASKRT